MVNSTPYIPKCMSTQHPDNVNSPFFCENTEIGGEDEIQEAYYVFSHLGCDEQMWDYEGKEVDNFVVKKLLSKYEAFFRKKRLGRDLFITLRVPNPSIEKGEAKILLETLESITRSYDTAKLFFKDQIPPIFEVVLPMATSASSLDRIYHYYVDFIIGKQHKAFGKGDLTICQWIGEFKPEKINIIPLFEDQEHMLAADKITKDYLKDKDLDYQRVFLARSDPAMNYGLVSAVLLNKIALLRLKKLEKKIKVKIHPIVGVGSVAFRGNLTPVTVNRVIKEYPSCQTFTIQSAFKYDYPHEQVIKAIKKLTLRKVGQPQEVDEKKALKIIKKYSREYQKQIVTLAPVINKMARFIPSRRKRKLHIGLFGYSRKLKKVTLPRVIAFTASLYSLGLVPEVLGLNALSKADFKFIKKVYINFEDDLRDSLKYLDYNSVLLPAEIKEKLREFSLNTRQDKEHLELTGFIARSLKLNQTEEIKEAVLGAGNLRKFLG